MGGVYSLYKKRPNIWHQLGFAYGSRFLFLVFPPCLFFQRLVSSKMLVFLRDKTDYRDPILCQYCLLMNAGSSYLYPACLSASFEYITPLSYIDNFLEEIAILLNDMTLYAR